MEKNIDINGFMDIEQKVLNNIDLLEILMGYCESKYEKSKQIMSIYTILEIITKTQYDILRNLDKLY